MRLEKAQVILCVLTAFVVAVPVGAMAGQVGQASGKQWTVMMYWDADNNLEFCVEFAMSTWEAALPDDSEVSIVALIDILSEDGTWIYDIVDGQRRLVDTWDEVNTSDPATLERFVSYCMDEYPAENTLLVLQDHGYSWRGLCEDETNGDTLMSLDGLATVLEDLKARGAGVDLLAFDACNMMSIEAIYELKDAVSYVVGSESMVPYDGLPYKMLITDLAEDPSISPEELAVNIVHEYVLYYSSKKDYEHIKPYNQDFATCSAFDMSKVDALGKEFITFSETLEPLVEHYMRQIEGARGYALIGPWANIGSIEWGIDIFEYAEGLMATITDQPDLTTAIMDFMVAYDSALLAEDHSRKYHDTVHGLTLNFPPSLAMYNSAGWVWGEQFVYHDCGLDIVAESQWYDCLMAYYGGSES